MVKFFNISTVQQNDCLARIDEDVVHRARWIIAALLLCLVLPNVSSATNRPNIIFILGDDMGWADTSLYGACQIPTPNLEALAVNGVLLSQYYGLPSCTPSRAATLTGLYPVRMGLQHDVLLPAEEGGMNLTVPTIAEHLRDLGYSTHAVGKWHLGYSSGNYTPTERGFDSFYGLYNYGEYYFTPITSVGPICGLDRWENETVVNNTAGLYSTTLYEEKAIEIIRRHDTTKPLFMYWAPNAAHGQSVDSTTDAPRRNLAKFPYIGDKNRTLIAGTIDALDESIGRVISALNQRGMLANSIVVFSSDNGGSPWGAFSNTGSNWPLRGAKGTVWEGAVRVPAILWSPLLQTRRGSLLTQMVHAVDWLPTLYSAAGGDPADLGTLDGIDLWPSINAVGQVNKTSWPRQGLLVNYDTDSGQAAYRDGDYKLVTITDAVAGDDFIKPPLSHHVPTPGMSPPCGNVSTIEQLNAFMITSLTWRTLQKFYSGSGGVAAVVPGWRKRAEVHCNSNISGLFGPPGPSNGHYLFDLANDPCETKDLSSSLPSVVTQITEKLSAYEAVAVPPKEHGQDPRGMPDVNNCVWARFEDTPQTMEQTCPCPSED